MPRLRRRLTTVLLHSGSRLLVPLVGPIVALAVVRLVGIDLWGEFVRVLVVVHLVAHIAGWGNRDYLLREFSRKPAARGAVWMTALWTRLAIACLACVTLLAFSWSPGRLVAAALLIMTMVTSQSFEVFVIYRRAFALALTLELASLGLLVASIVAIGRDLTVGWLLGLYALTYLLRSVVLWRRFAADAGPASAGRIDPAWLVAALPFFLLGFTGLLQSRADLYVVASLRPPEDIGRYQVYINLVVYLQSASALIVTPFLKGLYRMSVSRILLLSLNLTGLGCVVVALGIPAMALILRHVYGLVYPMSYFVAGALIVLPAFAYLPVIYALFKNERASVVVAVNVVGVAVSLGLMWQWLPRFGILGAAWAAAASQWAMLVVYGVQSWRMPKRDVVPLSHLS